MRASPDKYFIEIGCENRSRALKPGGDQVVEVFVVRPRQRLDGEVVEQWRAHELLELSLVEAVARAAGREQGGTASALPEHPSHRRGICGASQTGRQDEIAQPGVRSSATLARVDPFKASAIRYLDCLTAG